MLWHCLWEVLSFGLRTHLQQLSFECVPECYWASQGLPQLMPTEVDYRCSFVETVCA